MTQPEALRLTDALETAEISYISMVRAAAELRRLHAQRDALRQIVEDFPPIEAELQEVSDRAHRLRTQRDALLEALKLIVEFVDAPTEGKRPDVFVMRISKARAAIKKAEE
jgi:hypothetical protein